MQYKRKAQSAEYSTYQLANATVNNTLISSILVHHFTLLNPQFSLERASTRKVNVNLINYCLPTCIGESVKYPMPKPIYHLKVL
jgi:hypothetical protein